MWGFFSDFRYVVISRNDRSLGVVGVLGFEVELRGVLLGIEVYMLGTLVV